MNKNAIRRRRRGSGGSLSGVLFSASEPGFTFEPWDITTLYQDRAGTTPVTAAGQSVGLRLDKSQGLALGAELVANGDFSAGTGWTLDAGWEISSGKLRSVSAANTAKAYQALATNVGSYYRFQATVDSYIGTFALEARENTAAGAVVGGLTIGSVGLISFYFRATTTTTVIDVVDFGASVILDNISVRELTGNHQVAVSDAKRGVYGWMPKTGRRNLLTRTEEFSDAAWTPLNVTRTASSLVATAVSGSHGVNISSPLGGVGVLTQQVEAKANGYDWLILGDTFASGGGLQRIAFFNIATGVLGAVQGAGVTSTITPTSDGYFLCTVTFTSTNGNSSVAMSNADNIRTFTGDGVSGILVRKVQTELGSTATAYQKVVSQYDITEAGVPTCYYVQADGVDDAYVTPTITPNTDKVQVFAGVRKLSDAATGMIVESSTSVGSFNGSLNVASRNAAGYGFASRGTSLTNPLSSGALSPRTDILTGLGDISGDTATLRVNGVQVAQSTADQGTGNYLAYPAYIYARGGTSLPFNGLDFGHAVRFGPNLDAATIARVEALIARNTPEVTL